MQDCLAWCLGVLVVTFTAVSAPAASLLLQGGLVADGRGRVPQRADVRIEGERIAGVGKLKPRPNERVIDVGGMVVAPGFIDMHSHADGGLLQNPQAEAAVRQGITTVLVGMDGGSRFPLAEFLRKLEDARPALNVASMAGHATLRRQVMGNDLFRPARPEEVQMMKDLLEQEMQAGAFGLSTGLEYEPAHQATTDEVVELARVAARHGGFYTSHVRDEGNGAIGAFREVIEIGKRAGLPVQISHIKLGTRPVWGHTEEVAAIFRQARKQRVELSADLYPYNFWNSTIRVLVLDRDFFNAEKVRRSLDENGGATNIILARYSPDPAWEGKSLAGVARQSGLAPEDVYMKVVRETEGGRAQEGILGISMTEEDIRWFMRRSEVMFSTDGSLKGPHPRGAGTYPRILGRYVREQRVIPLGEAIHKMTALPARRLGLRDRGLLRPGFAADIVVFDPAAVMDRSTIQDPAAPPDGIAYVFANGQAVVEKGALTDARPGKVLRPAGRQAPAAAGQGQAQSPRWQLNLGLRYNLRTAPSEVNGRTRIPFGCDCSTFSPRFGSPYRLERGARDLGVIRAGYTVSYGEIFGVTYQQARFHPPEARYVQVSNPSVLDPLADLGTNARTGMVELPTDLVSPYSHQYNFTWQRVSESVETATLLRGQP